jgi:hypothetical protein
MLKLSMVEEVEEYAGKCLTYIKEAESTENAEYWLEMHQECKTLLNLFREMKMCWIDWARMKQIATLNREVRSMGETVWNIQAHH